MDIPTRRNDEDARKLALSPEASVRYLHHSDGSWSFVGDNGWLVSPEEYYAELDADVTAAIAAVTYAPIDVDLLADVRRGLLSMPPVIDIKPISVRDNELR